MLARLVTATLLFFGAALIGHGTQTPAVAPSRLVVVVSDLHMGEGRRTSGEWHPFEDFRWSPEFAEFLEAIGADGGRAVDLVLNGDTFELLQSSKGPCRSGAGLDCTEEEALARLDRVLLAHKGDIGALGSFARAGSNRVVLVPGDHDAALLFPQVGRRVVDALAAPPGRVAVAASGTWVSSDGRVLAEHGHQVGFSRGEQIIQDLYNRLEERYPIIDNLSAAGTGVKYALAAADGIDAGALAPRLLRALLLVTPWQQFRMELDDGEVEPPVWDIAQVRLQGAAFFVSSVPDDDPLKPAAASAAVSGTLAPLLQHWTDEEIAAVCDYRAAVRRARRRFEPAVTQFAPRGPAVSECPRTVETRGAQYDYFWRSRDLMFARHLEGARRRAQTSAQGLAVFVHGHTHLPDRSQTSANMISGGLLTIPMEGFSPVRGALWPIVINGGAWQRTVTPVQYERMRAERATSDDELLRLRPEQLAPCYSFVRIPPYTDAPAPAVRYWREADGKWGLAGGCGR